MRHLIVEPSVEGHYFVYLRLLVVAGVHRGDDLVLALDPAATETREFYEHLADLQDHFVVEPLAVRVSPKSIAQLARDHRVDHVVIPTGDRYLVRLAAHRTQPCRCPVTAVVMQDPRDVVPSSRAQRWRVGLKSLGLRRAAQMKRTRVLWLRSPAAVDSRGQASVYDPVVLDGLREQTSVGSALQALDPETFWFALVGALNHWKNPLLVIDAIGSLSGKRVGLIVAGVIAPELQRRVECQLTKLEGAVPVLRLDKTLSNGEFNQVVDRADCVVMAYSTHAPNSTMAKAASLGTRVIAAGSPRFREHAERYKVNAETCALKAEALSAAMSRASRTPAPPVWRNAAPDFATCLLDDAT